VVLYFQDFVPPQKRVHLLQGAPAVANGDGKEFDLHKKSIFKKNFDRQRRYGNNARGFKKTRRSRRPSSSFARFFSATRFAHK